MVDVATHIGGLPPLTPHDFAAFGPVEERSLPRIQRLTAAHLGRNWLVVPQVTHHDEVDVTAMEARRAAWNGDHPDARLTPVALLVKALASVLPAFETFNASLSDDGGTLVLKRYVHIGVAVDTPRGLMVPVLRDADRRSAAELAADLAGLAAKARGRGLSMAEMSGGCITISSLGHIGGTAFTPLVNMPEVAILGATAMQQRPHPAPDGAVAWRTMLPLSLSYDHRVVNGADAARLVRAIATALDDPALFA